jgi:hypothetical protein
MIRGWGTDMMYRILLALGSVLAVCGLALFASGLSVQDQGFNPLSLTPGVVAITGGCILVGLAFVIRALLRVERALGNRSMPRPARAAEIAGSAFTGEQAVEAARIPFPPKPKPAPSPHPVPIGVAASENPMLERLRERMPGETERLEAYPPPQQNDAALLPKPPRALTDEDRAEVDSGMAGSRPNGAGYSRTAPRSAPSGRSMRQPQQPLPQEPAKRSMFDSLWPKVRPPLPESAARPDVDRTPASAAAAAPSAPLPASPPAEHNESSSDDAAPQLPQSPAPQPPQPRASVSVLKSGVVEGMAYTLYSDGSIEAQLPQGTLRFDSITELRNHIERHS